MKNIIVFKKTGLKMLKNVYFACCMVLVGSLLYVGNVVASDHITDLPQFIRQHTAQLLPSPMIGIIIQYLPDQTVTINENSKREHPLQNVFSDADPSSCFLTYIQYENSTDHQDSIRLVRWYGVGEKGELQSSLHVIYSPFKAVRLQKKDQRLIPDQAEDRYNRHQDKQLAANSDAQNIFGLELISDSHNATYDASRKLLTIADQNNVTIYDVGDPLPRADYEQALTDSLRIPLVNNTTKKRTAMMPQLIPPIQRDDFRKLLTSPIDQLSVSAALVQNQQTNKPKSASKVIENPSQQDNRLRNFIIGATLVAGAAKVYSWSKPRQVTK
jgi:hypothetical protein